jgi:hypothetical protein
MKAISFNKWSVKLVLIVGALLTAQGCAKNVDKVNYNKWGYSFVSRGNGVDTTAQGGAVQGTAVPQSTNYKAPKASANGAYQRGFASSPNYRLVGGFHVNANQ